MRKIKSKIKISACYIVRNEEKTLARSIDSLKNVVDEIVIVDTGSTDNSISIAESYGAKIIQTTWQNDFSTPRNLAIDNATGDWIVMIDSDEYFKQPKILKSTIEKNSKKDAIFILRYDIDEDNGNQILNQDYYLRAFRNVNYLRFKGLIHENIENINGNNFDYVIASEDLILYHTGYSTSKAKGKLERNLAIINSEIEQIGLQPRHHIALVDCYFALEDYDKVVQHSRELLKTNYRPITGLAIFYRKTLFSMRKLFLTLDEIMSVLNEALKNFPNDKDFLYQYKLLTDYMNQERKI